MTGGPPCPRTNGLDPLCPPTASAQPRPPREGKPGVPEVWKVAQTGPLQSHTRGWALTSCGHHSHTYGEKREARWGKPEAHRPAGVATGPGRQEQRRESKHTAPTTPASGDAAVSRTHLAASGCSGHWAWECGRTGSGSRCSRPPHRGQESHSPRLTPRVTKHPKGSLVSLPR